MVGGSELMTKILATIALYALIFVILYFLKKIAYQVFNFFKDLVKDLIKGQKNKGEINNNNLFYKTIPKYKFDSRFYQAIRYRGYDYYTGDKIKSVTKYKKNYSSVISGTKDYTVKINYNDKNEIKEMSCTCPFFSDKGYNCKHMYALLCFLENAPKEEKKPATTVVVIDKNTKYTLINDLIEILNSMESIILETEKLGKVDDELYTKIIDYKSIIKKYKKTKGSEMNEDILNKAKEDFSDLEFYFELLECAIEEKQKKKNKKNN